MSNGNEGNGIVTDEQKVRQQHPCAHNSGTFIWMTYGHFFEWWKSSLSKSIEEWPGYLGRGWPDAASRLRPQSATPAEPAAEPQAVKAGDGLPERPLLFSYNDLQIERVDIPFENRVKAAEYINACEAQIAALTQQVAEMTREQTARNEAFDDIRDSVLNERAGLAEAGAGGDVINAVLGIMDDAWNAVPGFAAQAAVGESAQPTPAGVPSEMAYAQILADVMAKKFYPEAVNWQVGTDLLTVLTQIDNMVSGLVRSLPSTPAQDGEQIREAAIRECIKATCLYCADKADTIWDGKMHPFGKGDVNPVPVHIEAQYVPNCGEMRGWVQPCIYGGYEECAASLLLDLLTPPQATPTGESK